jgi:predicted nucleic acid-binding protein
MVTRTALDANVVVAAHMDWHADHDRALAAIAGSRGAGKRLVVPVPALVQAFSVMTRLPRGLRVRPSEARDALASYRSDETDMAESAGRDVWDLFDRAVACGVSGGGVHDADILACAERAGATRLLTLNPDDFKRLGPTDVEIVVPA